MADTAPGKDNPPRSPEELQAELRATYFQIPQNPIYLTIEESEKDIFFGKDEDRERIKQGIIERAGKHPEVNPILIKRFDELIAQTPTTETYKRMMHVLTEIIVNGGRAPWVADPERRRMNHDELLDHDYAFFYALELHEDNGAGIFTEEEAMESEEKLYDWATTHFGEGIHTGLFYGGDPTSPEFMEEKVSTLGMFTFNELKDVILKWRKEYEALHGEPVEEYWERRPSA